MYFTHLLTLFHVRVERVRKDLALFDSPTNLTCGKFPAPSNNLPKEELHQVCQVWRGSLGGLPSAASPTTPLGRRIAYIYQTRIISSLISTMYEGRKQMLICLFCSAELSDQSPIVRGEQHYIKLKSHLQLITMPSTYVQP